jgi:AcrR family transcriptional regulator
MIESLRDRKRRRARDDLVDAALYLFEKDGYERVTVADIAARAEQSQSTFFRYFGAKEDVLFDDVPGHLNDLLADIGRRLDAGDPPWPAVPAALAELIEQHYSRPGLARRRLNLWQREPALRARWADLSAQWESAIATVIRRQTGTSRDQIAIARAIAIAAIGSFRVVITTEQNDDTDDFLDQVAAVVDAIGAGLGCGLPGRFAADPGRHRT